MSIHYQNPFVRVYLTDHRREIRSFMKKTPPQNVKKLHQPGSVGEFFLGARPLVIYCDSLRKRSLTISVSLITISEVNGLLKPALSRGARYPLLTVFCVILR